MSDEKGRMSTNWKGEWCLPTYRGDAPLSRKPLAMTLYGFCRPPYQTQPFLSFRPFFWPLDIFWFGFEKITEEMPKSTFRDSGSPFQTFSESVWNQNRTKACQFSSICVWILMLVAKAALQNSCAYAVFCWLCCQIIVLLLGNALVPKIVPKPSPTWGTNNETIDAKTRRFTTSFFRAWASLLEGMGSPSWS